jgi:hypothetical protein
MKTTTGRFGFFVLGCADAAHDGANRCSKELKRMNDCLEQPRRT